MNKIKLFAITLLLTAATGQPKPDANCFITVTNTRKSGEVSEKLFSQKKLSEAECKKAAKAHETNFAPQQIVKKKVTVYWKPSSGVQK